MTADERATLKAEAVQALEAFIRTGQEAFRRKALGRLKALGWSPYPFTTKHAAGIILDELKQRD
jgi:hypothetical protein